MLQANTITTQEIGKRIACGRETCRAIIGYTSGTIFTRARTNDIIEAPAVVHIKCSCGFVTHLQLTAVRVTS